MTRIKRERERVREDGKKVWDNEANDVYTYS